MRAMHVYLPTSTSSSKKQILGFAQARTTGEPQGLPQELHFPLGAHGTELQWLSARPMSQ